MTAEQVAGASAPALGDTVIWHSRLEGIHHAAIVAGHEVGGLFPLTVFPPFKAPFSVSASPGVQPGHFSPRES